MNKEQQRIYSKNWQKQNPEKIKEYKKRYYEKLKKQGIVFQNDFYLYGRPKKELLKIWNYQCIICGSKENLQVHHIDGKGAKSLIKEKNNDLSNLVILCAPCHLRIEPRNKLLNVWSRKFPKCLMCGTVEKKYWSKGLCLRCYELTRREYKAEFYRSHYSPLTLTFKKV